MTLTISRWGNYQPQAYPRSLEKEIGMYAKIYIHSLSSEIQFPLNKAYIPFIECLCRTLIPYVRNIHLNEQIIYQEQVQIPPTLKTFKPFVYIT